MSREFASIHNPSDVAISKETTDYLNYIREKKNAKDAEPKRTEFIFADERMLRIKEVIHQIADNNVPTRTSVSATSGAPTDAQISAAIDPRKGIDTEF